MTTTTIGLLSAPKTSDILTTAPYHPEGFAHALLIDLSASDDLAFGDEDPIALSDAEKLAAYKLFLERLRTIVKEDGQKHPPIDMVRFIKTNVTEAPSNHTYRALDGLKPRHAEYICGSLEEAEIRRIDKLETPWRLESLLVSGLIDEYGGVFPPKACQTLQSLTLNYCSGVKYSPPGGSQALRYFKIAENDAAGLFTDICEKNAGLETRLQTLVIHDTTGACAYSSRRFKEVLKRCTSLVNLELVLGPVDVPIDEESDDEYSDSTSGDSEDDETDGGGQDPRQPQNDETQGGEQDPHPPRGDETGNGGQDPHQPGINVPSGQDPRQPRNPETEVDRQDPRQPQVNPWHGTEFPEEPEEADEQPGNAPAGSFVTRRMDWQDEPVYKPEALYLDLVRYFPASIENLRFRGPTAVVEDLPKWREAASDPSWLPNLKTLAFRLDVTQEGLRAPHGTEASAEAFSATQPEVQKFLDALSAIRPSVKVVESAELGLRSK